MLWRSKKCVGQSPHCHCWEEMGFLPMLAPELGTINSVQVS